MELTGDFDGAAHQFNKRLDDWHAHADSLELAARIVAFLGERLVNVRQKLRCHANAGIRNAKAKERAPVIEWLGL